MTKETLFMQLEEEIISCRLCPRLVEWREEIARVKRKAFKHWTYWGKPVPGFGDPDARLLIVGLAPGAHGSNRTGRMFTGDSSGDFLYSALHKTGFANQPMAASREDNLKLTDCFITAVCRCVPPDNKPSIEEMNNCKPYLDQEIALLNRVEGVVALGQIAFQRLILDFKAKGLNIEQLEFKHGAFYRLGNGVPWLLASYHPSRQNTQTGRLTAEMFAQIWERARDLLK